MKFFKRINNLIIYQVNQETSVYYYNILIKEKFVWIIVFQKVS